MKKYLALITVLLLVGMMAGCGKKMTAEERFDTVMNKNSKIMSMESEAETKMTMTVDNESMDMAMDMDIKMQRTEDKLEMSTETTNKVLGCLLYTSNIAAISFKVARNLCGAS